MKPFKLLFSVPLRKGLALSAFFSVGEAFPVIGITFLIQRALNKTVLMEDSGQLLLCGIGILFCTVLITLFALGNSWISLKMARRVSTNLHEKLLEKCFRLHPSFYQGNDGQESHTSILHDSDKVYTMGLVFLLKFFPAIVISCALSCFLLFISPFLFFLLAIVMPVLLVVGRYLEKHLKTLAREHRASLEVFSKGTRFLLEMMDLIQTYSTQKKEAVRQKNNMDQATFHAGKFYWFNSIYNLSQNFIVACASILILVVGGKMVTERKISWNQLIAFYVTVGMLKRYLQSFISSIPVLIDGRVSLGKIGEFLERPEVDFYQGKKQIAFRGALSLKNVSFGYSKEFLFKDVYLNIEPGEIVSLIGANGSGKSTIANLILGFYRPQTGIVLFENEPLEHLDLHHLRSSIGVVRQHVPIFAGTVGENILYGAHFSSLEEVEPELLKFVRDLPFQFDTLTGHNGLHLSGGQRQRIALARALVRQPKLLILDEPTNHLDMTSIELLVKGLQEWRKQMSILIISHHKELTALSHKAYELSNGTLTACTFCK